MSRFKRSAFCAGLFLLLVAPTARGAPILPSDFEPTAVVTAGTTTPLSAYDSILDLYTVDAALGRSGNPASLSLIPGTTPINDFIGDFQLSARVDDSGRFLSGQFAWFGQSATLGLAAGTELLSGTLTAVQWVGGSASAAAHFESLGRIDAIDPTLSALTGAIDEVLIYDYQSMSSDWQANPWSESFLRTLAATGGPDLWLRPAPVALPPTLLLLGLGLALLLRVRTKAAAE